MPSRMMHYVIAKHILNYRLIQDEQAFCLGAVIPDSWNFDPVNTKQQSHFMVVKEGKRGCDFKRFYDLYLRDEMDSFCLGYFTHLLVDTLYLKEIQANVLYQLKPDKRANRLLCIEEDMRMYNTYLCKNHPISFDLVPLKTWKVQELQPSYQSMFLSEFQQDLILQGTTCENPLNYMLSNDIR